MGAFGQPVSSAGRTRRANTRPSPHLLLCDLHVQDDVVDEVGQGFLHRALELVVLKQRVDKVKDAEDQVLKAQDFACRGRHHRHSDGQSSGV